MILGAAGRLGILRRDLRAREELDQLRNSEKRARLILDSAAERIVCVDVAGRISFVNSAACRLLRFTADEMLGQSSHDLIHYRHPDGSDFRIEESPIFAAFRRGETNRIDVELFWRKDRTGLPVEYGVMPILRGSRSRRRRDQLHRHHRA